jgi:hypothetical protein
VLVLRADSGVSNEGHFRALFCKYNSQNVTH